jgi:AraC-like DNA-binding protein
METPVHFTPAGGKYRADRSCGCDTGWRSLPFALLEASINGSWRIQTGRQTLRARAGQVIYLPAGLPHRLFTEGGGGMVSSWIYPQWEFHTLPVPLKPTALVLAQPGLAEAVEYLAQHGKRRPSWRESIRQQRYGLELLEYLCRDQPPAVPPERRIGEVLAFMKEHLDQPLSRGQLARVAGLSETRFHDVFTDAVGRAPMRQLNLLRLQRAITLLITSARPVGEIAQACGFASLYYFSRTFRRETGLSPTAFRHSQRPSRQAGPVNGFRTAGT